MVETVVSRDDNPSFAGLLDLNMLVISGGQERGEAEYRALFDKAGLKLTRIVPILLPLSLIEGVPK